MNRLPRIAIAPLIVFATASPAAAGMLGKTIAGAVRPDGVTNGVATAYVLDTADFEAVHRCARRSDCPARPLNPSGGGPADRNDGGRDDPPRNSGDGETKLSPKPPVLSALSLTPNRFWVFGPIEPGSELRYELTRASKVTLVVDRISTRTKRVASYRQNGRAGKNTFTFSGVIGSKKLTRGHYRLTAVPDRGRGDNARFAVITAPQVEGSG